MIVAASAEYYSQLYSSLPLHEGPIRSAAGQWLERRGPEISEGYTAPTAGLDSGYGTASKTSDKVVDNVLDNEIIDDDDAASDVTDNLSIDLPVSSQIGYVSLFTEMLGEAVLSNDLDLDLATELVKGLPDLIRAFSLRLSASEGPGSNRRAGNFARKHKEQVLFWTLP